MTAVDKSTPYPHRSDGDDGDGSVPADDQRWFLRKVGSDVHEKAFDHAVQLIKRDNRREMLRAWRKVFVDRADETSLEDLIGYVRGDRRRRHDVISNAVGALHARITKAEPAPTVTTQGGAKESQERALQLTDWLNYKFDEVEAYKHGADALHDALINGEGILLPTLQDGVFEVETCWVGDFAPEPLEEAVRRVRTVYRVWMIDRQVLIDRFPKKKKVIRFAGKELDEDMPGDELGQAADMVTVVEAWHICKGRTRKSRTGRHAVMVSSGTLCHEEYDKPYFPWVSICCERDPARFFGVGLVERMSGIQSELNEMTQKSGDALWLEAHSVWIPREANVQAEKIENIPGKVYTFTQTGNSGPIFHTPGDVAGAFTAREETLIRRAFELRGISQLSAQSQIPRGMQDASGKALIVHQDIEAERFLPLGRAYEDAFVALAERMMDLAQCAIEDEDQADALVAIGGDEYLEELDFRELHDKEIKRKIRISPQSALSQNPAGRLAEVQQLVEMGVLEDPEDVRELLNMPDLREYNRIRSMARSQVDKAIEQCLAARMVDGQQPTPHPYMPLQYAHKLAILKFNGRLTELDGETDEGLDMLGDFIAMVEDLMTEAGMAVPGKPAPAPGPEAAPPAGPMPGMPAAPMADPMMGMAPPMPGPMPGM